MLALIRHPKVAVPPSTCYGRLDVALASHAEIAGIVGQLTPLPQFCLWSSPMRRCVAVSDAIAQAFAIANHLDDRLLEMDFGVWEGLAWSDIPRAELDRWAACPVSFAPSNGESGSSLITRVTKFYDGLRQIPGSHVVVSHGGPLRLLAALALGQAVDLLAPSPALGSVQFIDWSNLEAGCKN